MVSTTIPLWDAEPGAPSATAADPQRANMAAVISFDAFAYFTGVDPRRELRVVGKAEGHSHFGWSL
jgi:hypothetical protein